MRHCQLSLACQLEPAEEFRHLCAQYRILSTADRHPVCWSTARDRPPPSPKALPPVSAIVSRLQELNMLPRNQVLIECYKSHLHGLLGLFCIYSRFILLILSSLSSRAVKSRSASLFFGFDRPYTRASCLKIAHITNKTKCAQ